MKNSKELPKRYLGLHFCEGVAEYREPGSEPFRIFLNDSTIKRMDASFEGRPVYVQHVDEVNLDKIQTEADGYVVKSFYNAIDGKHWVEFMVVSDRGHEAIRSGWRLSNAYIPKEFGPGGEWHGVAYQKEVTNAQYEHLAIVPNPRYDESVILTPAQFKDYCARKELDLKRLQNSKGDNSMFKFFKREKIENAVDLENSIVVLPESKKEMSVSDALKVADKVLNMHGYASPDHLVKLHDDSEMSVKDLAKNWGKMCQEMEEVKAAREADKAQNMGDEGDMKGKKDKDAEDKTENRNPAMEGDVGKGKDGDMKNKKKNIGDEGDEKAKKDKDKEDKTENSKSEEKNHFDALKNAEANSRSENPSLELSMDKVARGKARYGSGK